MHSLLLLAGIIGIEKDKKRKNFSAGRQRGRRGDGGMAMEQRGEKEGHIRAG